MLNPKNVPPPSPRQRRQAIPREALAALDTTVRTPLEGAPGALVCIGDEASKSIDLSVDLPGDYAGPLPTCSVCTFGQITLHVALLTPGPDGWLPEPPENPCPALSGR